MGSYKEFEWDDRKDLINREKHGLPLIAAAALLDSPECLVWPTQKPNPQEARSVAVGPLRGRLVTCVFVWRGQIRRIYCNTVRKP